MSDIEKDSQTQEKQVDSSNFNSYNSVLNKYESVVNDQKTIEELRNQILQASSEDPWMHKKDHKFNGIAKNWKKPVSCCKFLGIFN